MSALSGRDLRHPRRRRGPDLPPPRKRDRPVRGRHGEAVRRYWLHNGFVKIDHEKMSKSLGNFFTIRRHAQAVPSRGAALLRPPSHYRSPLDYSDQTLDDARIAMNRLYETLQRIRDIFAAHQAPGACSVKEAELPEKEKALLERVRTLPERFGRAWTTTSTRPVPWATSLIASGR